jgi:hypothetical protein
MHPLPCTRLVEADCTRVCVSLHAGVARVAAQDLPRVHHAAMRGSLHRSEGAARGVLARPAWLHPGEPTARLHGTTPLALVCSTPSTRAAQMVVSPPARKVSRQRKTASSRNVTGISAHVVDSTSGSMPASCSASATRSSTLLPPHAVASTTTAPKTAIALTLNKAPYQHGSCTTARCSRRCRETSDRVGPS